MLGSIESDYSTGENCPKPLACAFLAAGAAINEAGLAICGGKIYVAERTEVTRLN